MLPRTCVAGFTQLINNGATFFYTRIVSLQGHCETRIAFGAVPVSLGQRVNLGLYLGYFLTGPDELK